MNMITAAEEFSQKTAPRADPSQQSADRMDMDGLAPLRLTLLPLLTWCKFLFFPF